MRQLVGVLGGLIAGAGLGYIYSVASVEKKVREEYAASARMRQRAYEIAKDLEGEAPAESEDHVKVFEEIELISISIDTEPNAFGGTLEVDYSPQEHDPYHTPPQIIDQETGQVVEIERLSYISEDDYHEEDGHAKETLTFIGDGVDVHFFEDGVEIEDWKDRIGEGFLVDFQRYVPYGEDPVLYIRNHATDTDYQVIKEVP